MYLHERIVGEFHQALSSLAGRLSPWPFYFGLCHPAGGPSGFTPLGGELASSQLTNKLCPPMSESKYKSADSGSYHFKHDPRERLQKIIEILLAVGPAQETENVS